MYFIHSFSEYPIKIDFVNTGKDNFYGSHLQYSD